MPDIKINVADRYVPLDKPVVLICEGPVAWVPTPGGLAHPVVLPVHLWSGVYTVSAHESGSWPKPGEVVADIFSNRYSVGKGDTIARSLPKAVVEEIKRVQPDVGINTTQERPLDVHIYAKISIKVWRRANYKKKLLDLTSSLGPTIGQTKVKLKLPPGFYPVMGTSGTGKTLLTARIGKDLGTIIGLGEPESKMQPLPQELCVAVNSALGAATPAVIIDSFRVASAIGEKLMSGGVTREMAFFITSLDQACQDTGHVVLGVFNYVSKDVRVVEAVDEMFYGATLGTLKTSRVVGRDVASTPITWTNGRVNMAVEVTSRAGNRNKVEFEMNFPAVDRTGGSNKETAPDSSGSDSDGNGSNSNNNTDF